MSPVQQELNQRESPQALLIEAYESLGYTEGIPGSLLNATDRPLPGTEEEKAWLDKGDWLALAYKVGAEKVFFVRNDPVFVFCALQHGAEDENLLLETFRRVWCMSRPRFLFVAIPGELRVYRLDRPPAKNAETLRKEHQIELVTSIAEIAEKLKRYSREQVETGRLFADERFGGIDQRADKRLIQDLKRVREALLDAGLEPVYAHALIGRSIFIRYLEDRGIIDEKYFIDKVVKDNANWLEKLLQPLPLLDVASGSDMRRYNRILPDKSFTYALFRQLIIDFNGDMFPDIEGEEKKVTKEHLKLLQGFLLGHTNKNQPPLFLWAYDFQIIPIELISSIYEEFYHKQNSYHHSGIKKQNGRNTKQDDKKTHYTPGVLVEYVLSNLLPEERLATNPRILDPACGSGIFLVESFRRIVRYWVQQQRGEMLFPEALHKILKEQIRGIEINEEAVHVAAFSLYLALLHYQEPPAIRTRKLPNLIYRQGQPED
ncbi:MAG: DNA methyltransferase, partial [Ktedonobacteraceae bacterium]